MTSTRKFVCLVFCLPLLLVVGCGKKKASLPPKTLAPTVAVALPDELPLTEVPDEPAAPATQPAPSAPAAKVKPKKPVRSSTSSAKKSTQPPTAPATTPAPSTQTVAGLHSPKGVTSEAVPPSALATAIPSAQVLQQKEDTVRMMDATENTLKEINRSLSDDEKSMRSQIQSYLQQSRKATTEGDFERAYNLAKKAQLLADALVKKK